MAGFLLCRSACQALEGTPWVMSYCVVQAHKSLKRASWVESYCVIQSIRCLMGQPLYCLAANAGVWGKRDYDDGSTPDT